MTPAATSTMHPPIISSDTKWADCDDIRTSFTLALSAMYRDEVPLYGTLARIVSDVNVSVTEAASLDPEVLAMRSGGVTRGRLDIERHGAIRLGTPGELRTMARIFALLGLFPVGYYDLSEAGLPMHATCFRPITGRALEKNPFRVFTSVLRPELIKNKQAQALSLNLLERRTIFSLELLDLLELASGQQHGRLTPEQSSVFIAEALKTFRWRGTANATAYEYDLLKSEHPVLADIVCFGTSHINHLTPRTLDITAAQEAMEEEGLHVKEQIEGPPPRQCPILLRQTSFLAINESIRFRDDLSSHGSHRARFGEIEERGAAVTPAGRALYDRLVQGASAQWEARETNADESQTSARQAYDAILTHVFSEYPDSWGELRRENLVYFTYRRRRGATHASCEPAKLENLLRDGVLEAVPITYEDFLPLSAAGIFRSNLDASGEDGGISAGRPDQQGMEEDMGVRILSMDVLYQFLQEKSLDMCSQQLGIQII